MEFFIVMAFSVGAPIALAIFLIVTEDWDEN